MSPVSKESVHRLYKWIEKHSCNLPCENEAKHALEKLNSVIGLKVISKHYPDNKKCNHCNWESAVLYSFASNDIDSEGLCGQCFMDMIVEEKMQVISTGNGSTCAPEKMVMSYGERIPESQSPREDDFR